jgi:LacI family transcriptional regulator
VLDIRNPYFTDVARGVEDRLGQDDHTLMLASSDDDPERERRYLRLFEEHGVLGMLVVPGSAGTRAVEEVHRRGTRVVLLDHASSVPGIPSVAVDDRAGGALAAGHLLSRGHRRVVVLNGPHTIRQCVDRWQGARDAVAGAGLDPDEVLREVTVPTMDARGGDQAMRGLVEQNDGAAPEAVMCVNDLVAIGAQRALRALGGTALLRSTALVGYDDLDIASELASPLTSVRQPALEMGYRAAAILLEDDASTVQDVVFQPELVVRDSSTYPV